MQELHLADRYRVDENIRVQVKMLLALSCVSSVDVTNELEMLVESCPREIDPVLDYWEDNYIVRKRQNLRAESRFAYGNTETLDYLLGIAYNLKI